MSLVIVDFETFYGPGYGLKELTTEEYVRDHRFQVIGVSLKVDDHPAKWYSGSHEYIKSVLAQIPWDRVVMAAHNARFDATILNWIFGFKPKKYLCTMQMARGLVGLDTSCSLENLGKYFQLQRQKGHEVVKAYGKRLEDFNAYELAEYGAYCENDSEMCRELVDILLPCTLQSEVMLQDWTIRSYVEPKLVLNEKVLTDELAAYQVRKGQLLAACGVNNVEDLRSDDTLAELLVSIGCAPPMKFSPKRKDPVTGEPLEVYAFAKSDPEFFDLLDDPDERVAALVEARLGLKTSIVESRLLRLIGIARRGPMPMPVVYAGATPTRRWAGDEKINVQNFPRSKPARNPDRSIILDAKGKPVITPSPLRKAICAPPGKKMAAADLSQIELRVNCWHSGQRDILDALAGGGDTYSDMATVAFGFHVNKHDHPNERFVGKTATLGCGYQCGSRKFQTMLRVDSRKYDIALDDESFEFADRVVKAFRAKNTKIVDFWYRAADALPLIAYGQDGHIGPYEIRDRKIWLPNGSYLYYPDLRYTEKEGENEQGCEWTYLRMFKRNKIRKKIYGGLLTENITQAVARLFVSDAMLRLESVKYNDGRQVFDIVFTVHDEIVVLFDEGLDEDWVRATLKWAMTTNPIWAPDLPLACDIGIGYNYAECK